MNGLEILEDIIQYKHLSIVDKRVIYLGYDLGATKTELEILRALLESPNAPLSADEISSRASLDMSKENIAYHICSINNKAKLIGNRNLIKNIVKIGYFLNEEM